MTTIGHFKKAGSEYVGEISTLNFQTKNIRIVPETTRLNDAAPSHRLFLGKYEIGAGWIHRSGENRNYLSIKLDDPALQVALPSSARYVGALGSNKTHAARVERLRAYGLADDVIARLYAPIGLPIGGRTPAEIALSIMAEIVAVRNERQVRNG